MSKPIELIAQITNSILDIKGENVVLLDLTELENSVTQYFIICSGTSSTHVSAIAQAVQRETKTALKENPWHVENSENSSWVLLDYVNIVVNVFQEETREYYDLEGLWKDAKVETFS